MAAINWFPTLVKISNTTDRSGPGARARLGYPIGKNAAELERLHDLGKPHVLLYCISFGTSIAWSH
jgi:hypothetical protein